MQKKPTKYLTDDPDDFGEPAPMFIRPPTKEVANRGKSNPRLVVKNTPLIPEAPTGNHDKSWKQRSKKSKYNEMLETNSNNGSQKPSSSNRKRTHVVIESANNAETLLPDGHIFKSLVKEFAKRPRTKNRAKNDNQFFHINFPDEK